MRTLFTLVFALLFVAPAPAQSPLRSPEGSWSGIVRVPAQPMAITVTMTVSGSGWAGTFSAPGRNLSNVPFESVVLLGDSLRLSMSSSAGGVEFRGRVMPDSPRIAGIALINQVPIPFELAPSDSPAARALLAEASAAAPTPHAHPDSARIITEDIPRFWAAYDVSTPENRAAVLQAMYLDPGSAGLQDFILSRIGTAGSLARTVNAHPRYFASARASMLRIAELEPQIRVALRRLKALYPEAVFPDVYFVVGRMSSGGVTSPRALLIGAEMYGRTDDMPEEELGGWHRMVLNRVEAVPYIVAHELIHYQQSYARDTSLLARAIVEGTADFIGELISGGQINVAAHAYGLPRERELWCEFRTQMRRGDVSNWMYDGDRSDGRPADLGYFIGYRIARAYHERVGDDAAAVRHLLTIRDFDALLRQSGYSDRFVCA